MYRVKLVLAFVTIFLLTFSLISITEASHKPSHNPPGQGDGGGTTTDGSSTTSEDEGGSGPSPISVILQSPQGGDTLKRGQLTLLVKGATGINPESDMDITVTSDLFETVKLTHNFEQRGIGIYGANVTIGRAVEKGTHSIVVKGQKGSAVNERRILMTLDPTIAISSSIEGSYYHGDRIFFEGDLKYFDDSLAKNASLEVALFAPGDYFFNLSTTSDQNGKFAVSYPISFAEPEGNWEIRITARDRDGNEGSTILKTKISTPEGVVFYTVNFLSPFKDAEFKRGSTVPITVEVKDEDRLLEKAKLEFKNPRGELIPITEVRSGIYSLEYHLTPYDPLGVWQISAQALKTIDGVAKAGGNRIKVTVLPETLNLVLLQPTTFDFFTGQQISFKTKLAYGDGIAVENAKVTVKINNETVILSENELGIYESTYLFSTKDAAAAGLAYSVGEKLGTTNLELYAEDVYGNSVAVPQKAITVKSVSKTELMLRLFYYGIIARYWYLFLTVFLLLVLVTEPVWYHFYLKTSLRRIQGAEERAVEVQKDIQRKYFKRHSMSRDDYDKLMLKYREQTSAMKEKKLKIQKKLSKKK